jgi:glycerol kinase
MILVVDVGTSSVRAAVLDDRGQVRSLHAEPFAPSTPSPGLVEFDALELAAAAIRLATAATNEAGPVRAVGISAQRASTVVWERATGVPIGPALGWQDLRTVVACIMAKAEHGLHLAPNQTATKAAWLLETFGNGRTDELCIGTVDTWLAWTLSRGRLHVTDHTNAAVTGLTLADASAWSERTCELLGIPLGALPRLVDSSGPIGDASALPGSPPITALVGDQQASLVGQSCVRAGDAKITFGTGGMLDMCLDDTAPTTANRSRNGTFPIVAYSRGGQRTWGAEGIMLSAGTNVEWLVHDLAVLDTPAASHDVASAVDHTDGVVYVPALLGLGTPHWDYGARGALFGITRGTTRAHVVRAVLEGVAHRGADLVDAVVADTGRPLPVLRIDGGMSANPTFVQALADASGRPVEVSPHTEATTVGAAYLAGLAVGIWDGLDDIASSWSPAATVEPSLGGATISRDRWREAVHRARGWIPDLSALDF